jgi:hypothetical protein
LDANAAQVGGNALNLLLLSGLLGLSELLALTGRGEEGRHCGIFFSLEELTEEEILI